MWGIVNWKKNKSKGIPVLNGKNLSEYDEYVENEDNKPCGMRVKKFYRASVNLFPELIDSIQNDEECSYLTNFNDVIMNDSYVPKYMSVLIKDNSKEIGFREMVASNVMNYFGISTTFEKLVEKEDGSYGTLSVDFVPSGKEFFTLGELGINTDLSLELDDRTIRKKLMDQYRSKVNSDYFAQVISKEEFESQLNKLIEEYMYAFLVRTYILGDQDFHEDNCGVIMDTERFNIDNFVQFDYEATLSNSRTFGGIDTDDFMYVARRYPLVLRRLLHRVEELLEKDDIGHKGVYQFVDYANLEGVKNDKFLVCEELNDNLLNVRSLCMDSIRDLYMTRENFEDLVI